MATVGIDVGGSKVMVARRHGETLDIREAAMPTNWGELVQLIAQHLESLGVSSSHAIGMGIPGVVQNSGTCWVPNCPALHGVNVTEALSRRFSTTVVIDNDARLALWAESQRGGAQGRRNVLLVAVGTGIGGAIMMDGQIMRGNRGTAGAFGWLLMGDPPMWPTWESRASGKALDLIARDVGSPDGPRLVRDVRQRGSGRFPTFLRWIEALGVGIASLISIFDPEMVLVSGGIARDADVVMPLLQDVVQRHSSPSTRSVRVETAALGHQAVVWGAVLKAEEHASTSQGGTK